MRGGLILLVFGYSSIVNALFFIPSAVLLVASKAPTMGFMIIEETPFAIPTIKPSIPY